MAPILQVRGVRKAFRDLVAVDDVSFELGPGEVFGLLGPNGAGKTTLIRMILDIYRPDAGEVAVFGHALDRSDLDRIGYLPEERGLYRRRKVIQVLSYLGQLKGLSPKGARAAADRWLEALSMQGNRERKLDELSKGNQQKIQLVGTLVGDPKLLVWDEPFSGLDPVNVNQVRELIATLRAQGTSMILSTHLMNQAEALCDRVGLIHRGRLVLEGAVDTVRSTVDPHAWTLETDAPVADWPELATVEATVTLPDRRRYTLRLADTGPEALLQRILAGGHRVAALQPLRPSLEEVFLRAVA